MAIKLDQLPPALRQQVLAKMRAEDAAKAKIATNAQNIAHTAFSGSGRTNTQDGTQTRNTRGLCRRKTPNKTELEYNRRFLKDLGRYEAVTLRLPGGSRYTADWVTFDGHQMTLHECKGSYRHHSHNRAQTAFREAVAAFPAFRFVWATRQADGTWELQEFHDQTINQQKGQSHE